MTDLQTYGHPALQALNATFSKEQAETLLALMAAVGGIEWDSLEGKPASFPPSAHTHVIDDVTGLQDELDGKQPAGSYAASSHTHAIGNVTGLQAALDGKAGSSHGHAIADITGLAASLSTIEGRLDDLEEPEE